VELNSKANKRETQVFPPNSKHIQQRVVVTRAGILGADLIGTWIEAVK